MIFKVFNDCKRLLDRSDSFIMLEGKKITASYQGHGKNLLTTEL